MEIEKMRKQKHLVIKRPLQKNLDDIKTLIGLHFTVFEACFLCGCTYKDYKKFLPDLKDAIKFANECRQENPSIENDKDIKAIQKSIFINEAFMHLYVDDKPVNFDTCRGYFDLVEILKSDYTEVVCI